MTKMNEYDMIKYTLHLKDVFIQRQKPWLKGVKMNTDRAQKKKKINAAHAHKTALLADAILSEFPQRVFS